jgi:glycosyltransferase involved in cell wall biosynthesis
MTADLADNSMGRTYCLWLLAREIGWHSTVLSTKGQELWEPLRGSDFSGDCHTVDQEHLEAAVAKVSPALIISVKPLVDSLGRAVKIARSLKLPLLLDIDDPDIEVVLAWDRPVRRLAKTVLKHQKVRNAARMRKIAQNLPTIVSNPVIERTYGGTIVPHIRLDTGHGRDHLPGPLSIAFVGTNRPHKGLELLRQAVATRRDLGYTLTITDVAPSDAMPWESWVGQTSINAGLELVANADVIVVPSLPTPYSRGQLPAKLVDAMLLGRAVAVSDLEPMRWAVGRGGIVFEPGSATAIARALSQLADPDFRQMLGANARSRALQMFIPSANADKFRRACEMAIRAGAAQ